MTVELYLSSDGQVNASDSLEDSFTLASLVAGGSHSQGMSLTAPGLPGTYYLAAVVDRLDGVWESNEGNNWSGIVELHVTQPDLTFAAMQQTSILTEVSAGVVVPVEVLNIGTAAADGVTVELYLSSDGQVNASDSLEDSFTLASLVAGGSHSQGMSLTAPGLPGTYYLAAVVDRLDGVWESNESNNWSGIVELHVTQADLDFAPPQHTTIQAEILSMVFVPIEVRNVGDAAANNVTVELYFSPDSTVDVSDTLKDSFSLTVLSAGGSHSQDMAFVVPGKAGTYYVAAVADRLDVVAESNEFNNISAVITLEVLAPQAVEYFAFSDYFPLEIGLSKAYVMSQINPGSAKPAYSLIRTVVRGGVAEGGGAAVEGDHYEIRRIYSASHANSTFYTSAVGGLYLRGQQQLFGRTLRTSQFDDPFMMCPAEMYVSQFLESAGDWSGLNPNGAPWTGWYSQQLEVVGFEQVIVPAGTFNALKLTFNISATQQTAGKPTEHIYDNYSAWLAEGIGVVREAGQWRRQSGAGNLRIWTFEYQMAMQGVGAGDKPDLAALFDSRFVMPSVGVPGQKFRVPVAVWNVGSAAAKGNIAVDIYASADQTLDAGDVRVGRTANARVNLANGKYRIVNVLVNIPAQIDPGVYYLIAHVDADDAIPEDLEENNFASTDTPSLWTYAFGSVGGKRNVRLTVLDGNGTPITFRLRGSGYGEVIRDGTGHLNVTYYLTNASSTASFSTPRRTEGVINDITVVDGSLRALLGRTIDLIGDVNCADGWLGKIVLDDVLDDHTITIGPPARRRSTVTLSFDSVGDLSIFSATPINRLTALEWLNENETPDQIVAPWLGNLRIKGRRANLRRGIVGSAGHFGADLTLSGTGDRRPTLRTVRIAGDLYDAEWNIVGRMGPMKVGGIVENTTVRTTGNMGPLRLGRVRNSDFLAGAANGVRHASSAAEFVNTGARIQAVIITGNKLPAVGGNRYWFENSNFSAASIGRVSLLNLQADNGGQEFGLFALAKDLGGREITFVRYRDTVLGGRWNIWRPADGELNILPDFTAQVLEL